MPNPIHHIFLSAIGGAAMAAVGVFMMMKPAPTTVHSACFAIAPGICFSGSTEWVAAAAAAEPKMGDVKLAMASDAI